MTELLLLISLIAPVTTPVEDCVKTRTCAAKTDFEICLYPKKCAPKAAEAVAQFQPCVWPNTCAKPAAAPVLAQFQPCVWPNRCSGRRSESPLI